jgi:hypothetical protein
LTERLMEGFKLFFRETAIFHVSLLRLKNPLRLYHRGFIYVEPN